MLSVPAGYWFQYVARSNRLLVPVCYWIHYVTSSSTILGPVCYRFQHVTRSSMSLGPTSSWFPYDTDSNMLNSEVWHFHKISTDACFLCSTSKPSTPSACSNEATTVTTALPVLSDIGKRELYVLILYSKLLFIWMESVLPPSRSPG
jgi:hypothetical protein